MNWYSAALAALALLFTATVSEAGTVRCEAGISSPLGGMVDVDTGVIPADQPKIPKLIDWHANGFHSAVDLDIGYSPNLKPPLGKPIRGVIFVYIPYSTETYSLGTVKNVTVVVSDRAKGTWQFPATMSSKMRGMQHVMYFTAALFADKPDGKSILNSVADRHDLTISLLFDGKVIVTDSVATSRIAERDKVFLESVGAIQRAERWACAPSR